MPALFCLEKWPHGSPWAWTYLSLACALATALPFTYRKFHTSLFKSPFPKPWVLKEGRFTAPEPQPIDRASEIPAAQARRELLSDNLLDTPSWNDEGFLERFIIGILSHSELSLAKAILIDPKKWNRQISGFALSISLLWLASKWRFAAIEPSTILLAVFFLTLLSCVGLFYWNTIYNQPLIRLLPVSRMALWKSSTKVNGLVLALLLPLSFLAPATTPFSIVGYGPESHGLPFPGKMAAYVAYMAILASALGPSIDLGSFTRSAGDAVTSISLIGLYLLSFCLPVIFLYNLWAIPLLALLIPAAVLTTYFRWVLWSRTYRSAALKARGGLSRDHLDR